MTTLFNALCPMTCLFLPSGSQELFLLLTGLSCFTLLMISHLEVAVLFGELLFPSSWSFVFSIVFKLLLMLNLLSLIFSGWTVTAMLSFNFFLSLTYWVASVLLFLSLKSFCFSSFLPSSSPMLLSPFLCVIELVSMLARPITLCFRLLANMCAGHVILSLVFKANWGCWLIGLPLLGLETLVSFIQAFVFSMLVLVYFQEAVEH